ncbi:YeiH family protein [Selenomonas sp. oral taxon 138]|uniref:YeiH family protein n=1 Tax=Selenomonas sp. oral taxon 138 TaxID=712532 RepID=UPI000563C26D|nr:YeiH family protein [Selenomonas sp. oral taxon 138]
MKREYMDGILYALLFAIPAYILGLYFPIVGGPVFGILLGMLFAKKRRPQATESGIKFTGKKILQYAIILLGFEMNLFHVVEVGEQSLYVMIFTLLAAFGAAFLMGKVLGMDRDMTALVGAGTAICGGSAIAAVAPVIGAKDRDVVISIATIFFFNVLAVFIFPFLGHSWGMSDAGFGMWAGTAINDTSSVVAAGYAYSHDAGAYATIVKLTRTLMIVPVCLFFALLMMRSAAQSGAGFSLKRIFPMFVLYFVLACIVNTTGILPAEVSHGLGMLGKFSIVLAMSAIGLNTDLPSLLKHGTRPLLLGMVCWIAVAGTSLIVQYALGLL